MEQKAYFAGGCFWGVEAAFAKLEGVVGTAVGYANGTTQDPTYEEVCTGRTGHAETVEVRFDPERTDYAALVAEFWRIHDPTQRDRQGPDVGTQYRSAIFTAGDEQQRAAHAAFEAEQASGRHARPLATAIEPLDRFWRAEEYHQQYLAKRGCERCP